MTGVLQNQQHGGPCTLAVVHRFLFLIMFTFIQGPDFVLLYEVNRKLGKTNHSHSNFLTMINM